MSIITKCPSCGTTFRVTPQQLQAQQGMVRCGRCASVFDGFKTLATLSDITPAEIAPAVVPHDDMPAADVTSSQREEVRPEPQHEASAAMPVQEAPPAFALPEASSSLALPESAPAVLPDDSTVIEPLPMAQIDAVALEPAPMAQIDAIAFEPVPAAQPVAELRESEPFVSNASIQPPPRRRAGGWTLGVLLLLAGLALQGAYFYRSEIAASVPEARPYLNKMCELLRCTVALPQRPRQISIEASDMQATDPANPGLIALTTTLRNQAGIELGYPALDVVLTNTKEHTVARRIFLPADYLAAGNDPRSGIAPNAEFTVRLDLDTGDLGAAGFRLDVLAAPAL